jgi:nucleotidyltransferase substrate binding protein (TIGR01987 family)
MSSTKRWRYRLDNYKKALGLLREGIELRKTKVLSSLEAEGVIQRFEYTWELAWKMLKDYLEHEGVVFDKITPKSVIITAIQSKIIADREIWMQALDDRNKMSHQYDQSIYAHVIDNIQHQYLLLFEELDAQLEKEAQ